MFRLSVLAAASAAVLLAHPAPTIYLQTVADRYQSAVYVYRGPDDAGNHFSARGELDNTGGTVQVPAMDEVSLNAPCLGDFCITATFDPTRNLWGGWYFMNGVLTGNVNQPVPNWGTVANAGYNLTGATELRFKARGASGGEKIEFFCFGVGYNPDTGAQIASYPDKSRKVSLGIITLGTAWQEYSIPLGGVDLSYVLGGFGWIATAAQQPNQTALSRFYLDDIRFLKPRPDEARFLVSYETRRSTNASDLVLRNAAFVYDNAVALIALAAAGDLARARAIADAILYAQDNDRFFNDGRIRNAYQGGDLVLYPGWLPNGKANTVRMPGWSNAAGTQWFEDEFHVSTATGNAAWAMLGLLDFYERTSEVKYLNGAIRLGDWVIANTADSRGAGGFSGGFDGWETSAAAGGGAGSACPSGQRVNGQCKRLYKSTEHNIDLYSAFARLNLHNPQPKWAQSARQAKLFLASMWDASGGKFWTGTGEDGVTVNRDVVPADVQAWAVQALGGEGQPYRDQALAYVEANHKTSRGYGFKQNGGNSCGDQTWFEGTSQVALSYLLSGNRTKYQSIIDTIHQDQAQNGAMAATNGACLNTGFTLNDGSPWLYYPRPHVGATAWFAIAEAEFNPFRADLYSPSLGAASMSFGNQTVNVKSQARLVTLRNPGASPLSIQSLALSGPGAADYAQTNNCPSSLGAGAECTIAVTLTPSGVGTRVASLLVTGKTEATLLPATYRTDLAGTGVTTCTYSLSPGNLVAAPGGAFGSFLVTPAASSCAWTAASNAAWISITSGSSGTGTGTINFTVEPNAGPARSGGIAVGGQTFTVSQAALATPGTGLHFVPVTPCRLVDTREDRGSGLGKPALAAAIARSFNLPAAACGIPAGALAYALNVTVVPKGPLGYITLWPTGQDQPFVSTLNSVDGRIKANAAIVPAGANGAVSVFATDATELILDVNGYFVPAGASNAGLAFYPISPCRVVDTRWPNAALGGPAPEAGKVRSFPVRDAACGIPASAQAYSVNATVVPSQPLGYLTLWATGRQQPFVSTLNAPKGKVVANAAIVPAGDGGAISAYLTDPAHLVIDINGYFAPPGAPNGQRFFTITPCRLLDTREPAGSLAGPVLAGDSVRSWPITHRNCGWPAAPAAYSLNATVVPTTVLGYLTLWPSGGPQPFVSTLNAVDDKIVANAAIVPAGSGPGSGVSSYVTEQTHLILDANGYFAP